MHKTNNNIKKEKGNGGLEEQKKKRQPKPIISAHKTDGLFQEAFANTLVLSGEKVYVKKSMVNGGT